MNDAKMLRKRVTGKGQKIHFTEHDVQLQNGCVTTLDVIEHPGAAAIVAIDNQGRVLLLRQYRYAVQQMLWEVPAGTLDDDEHTPNGKEAPLACAKRELIEEAGVDAQTWTSLGHIVTVPGFCDERIHIFLAEDLQSVEATRDDDEIIDEVCAMQWTQIFAMVSSGEICDAKTLAALWRARLFIDERAT